MLFAKSSVITASTEDAACAGSFPAAGVRYPATLKDRFSNLMLPTCLSADSPVIVINSFRIGANISVFLNGFSRQRYIIKVSRPVQVPFTRSIKGGFIVFNLKPCLVVERIPRLHAGPDSIDRRFRTIEITDSLSCVVPFMIERYYRITEISF